MLAAQYGGEHAAAMMRVLVDAGAEREQAGCGRIDRADDRRTVWGEHGSGMSARLSSTRADANKQSKDGTALMWAAGIGGEHGGDDARARRRGSGRQQADQGRRVDALMVAAEHGGEHGAR